jgi:hypothetical protein
MKERMGANKKSMRKIASKALTEGIAHKETTGQLNKYMTKMFFHSYCNNIRIYQQKVFLFSKDKLITVLPLPKNLIPAVNKINKRKEAELNGN